MMILTMKILKMKMLNQMSQTLIISMKKTSLT
jgi:hypothetical protein